MRKTSEIGCRILLTCSLVITGLVLTSPATASAAGCADGFDQTLSGTAEGADGRFVSAQVSFEFFTASGVKIGMDGCPMGDGYAASVLVNERPGTTCCFILPGEGSETPTHTIPSTGETFELERRWAISGIPANAHTVWIETYTKAFGSFTDNSRYGNSLRRPIALNTSGIVVRQPLNCGITNYGIVGDAARLTGKVYDNGRLVTPTRISAFSTSPDRGDSGPILSFDVEHDHPTDGYEIHSLTPGTYTLFVTAARTTQRVTDLIVAGCGDNVQDIAVRGPLPPSFGVPVSGDWDGDGDDEPGIWRDGMWVLRSDAGPDATTLPLFVYGVQAGDVPVVGDWDGDGDDEPGIFRNGIWHLRSSSARSGTTVGTARYGIQPGDVPVPGDWDGDGFDEPGIFRSGRWHFREHAFDGARTAAEVTYGRSPGDVPVPGDWDGDGDDEPGIFRGGTWHARSSSDHDGRTYETFAYGLQGGDVALSGNWTDDVGDKPGIYRERHWHLRNSLGQKSVTRTYPYPA